MKPLRAATYGPPVLTIVLMLALATTVAAGDFEAQFTQGNNGFFTQPPCPVNQFPTFESIAPIPKVVDPFEEDFVPVFCQIQVSEEGKGVRKAKGRFTADLLVLDNNTGVGESFSIDRGRFRTNNQGQDSFDFQIPTEIFADGFESGDVSAWSYTRADFTNRKTANNVSMSCNTSTDSSGSD